MSIETTAKEFFEACETGQGWEACSAHCHGGAGFACQSDALADVALLSDYAEWMKGLLTPIPDGKYELTAFATDDDRQTVVATAVFSGTQTGQGGPIAPTGNRVDSDYAYVMQFRDGRINHMTKIWNDVQALRALGWG